MTRNEIKTKKALNCVSEKIGIINSIAKIDSFNGDPNCYNYGACAISMIHNDYQIHGGSCNFEKSSALLGAIGECIERYCANFFNKDEMVYSDYMHISSKAIAPEEYTLFHDNQYSDPDFRYQRFSKNTELSWFPMRNLCTGSETFVPGQMIYLPFFQEKNLITPNVSTGLAAHSDFYSAILNAIYEVVERDGFSNSWYQMLPLEKIIIDDNIQNYINQFDNTGYDINIFDINFDLDIPAVLIVGFIETELGKMLICSASARWTYSEAIKKAIFEFFQSVSGSRANVKIFNGKHYNSFKEIQTFEDHSWYYLRNQENWKVFDKWLSTKPSKRINFEEIDSLSTKEKIYAIVNNFKTKKLDILVKDITTPDAREIGYYVVKVIIPQLVPLSGNYNFYYLGGERLYNVPKLLGCVPKQFDKLNHMPHPFP